MNNYSQTQISNFAVVAGLVVIIANQFGWVLAKDQVMFVVASLWSLGWAGYNYYQRFRKGDITLGGKKINV